MLEQKRFIDAVRKAGGVAGIAHDEVEAEEIICPDIRHRSK